MTTSTANCDRCGQPIAPGARFCPSCGSDVSGQQGNIATAYVPKADMARATMGADALVESLRHATVGEYDILGELGRGGMATVYLAHDISLDRKVAIKVMSPALLTGEGMVERFKREARTAGALSHPHIIPIYAVREAEHLVYFVMKFVEGRPLDSIIKEVGPLPIPMVQTILQQVGSALGYAHRRGVIHRDIKPANIMIDSEGWAVVTDFGIAKVTEAHGLTQTGATVGTPSYMSPEQCAAKDITGASDQYSFGIVAFEMLTGKLPFTGDSIMTIMYAHFNEPPPPIEHYRPDGPPELVAAVMRMLEKEPASRWPDLDAAIAAMGSQPLKHDDPIRTQMMTLAATGMSSQMMKRLSTPRSPLPAARTPKPGTKTSAGRTGFKTAAATAAQQTGLTLRPRQVTVSVGGAVQLTASQRKTGGATLGGEEITWASTDAQIATVSDTGLVTAVSPGTAVITAICGTVSATGSVTVTPAEKKKGGKGLKLVGALVVLAAVAFGAWRFGPWSAAPDNTTGTNPPQQTAPPPAPPPSNVAVNPPPPAPSSQTAPPPVTRPTSAANTARVNDSLLRVIRVDAATARARAASAGATPADLQPGDAERDNADRLARANRVPDALTAFGNAIARWNTAERTARDRAAQAVVTAPPPAPPPAPVPPPVAAPVDPTPMIREAIATYARAIESRDLNQVRSIFPALPARNEQGFRTLWEGTSDLKVTYQITDLQRPSDGSARVTVAAVYDYLPPGSRRRQQQPVPFVATLERSGTAWRITAIQ